MLNGVWAQAHKADSDHDSHTVPHVHMDMNTDTDIGNAENLAGRDENSDDHSHENHFHTHLHAFITSNNLSHFEQRFSEKPLVFMAQLSGLIHTPPVPPPTV